MVTPVVSWTRSTLRLDVAALRAVAIGADGGANDRLYEVEWLGGDPPAGARWAPADDLPPALADAVTPALGDRQPWYRAGWLGRQSDWIDARCRDAGIRRRGPLEQVRSWGRSSLQHVDTDRGRLWAKAVPGVFVHEILVTDLLADVDPGVVPPLVAADLETGRMLLEHIDGPGLDEIPAQVDAWAATLARLAEVQRVLAEDADVLRVAGVPAAPLADLAGAVPGLLARDDLLLVGRPGGLTRAEAARLRDQTPALVDATERLAVDGLPPSLDHGDLSASQVIVGAMGPVFLDWSDATITHPFLAAASFLMDRADVPSGADGRLAAAYLDGWSRFASPARLRSSLDLARVVHPLHMTRLYAERILPGLEQPWEMDRMVPRFLRTLLERSTPVETARS